MSVDNDAAAFGGVPADSSLSRRAAPEPQIETAGFGVWQWSVTSNRVTLSGCAETIHGLDEGSFSGTLDAFSDLIHPEDRDRAIASLFATFSSGVDRFVEYRSNRPASESEWIFTWVNACQTSQGSSSGLMGICLGSATQRHAEDALQRALTQVDVALDEVLDGITLQTPSGEHIYANAAAHRILGFASVAELRDLSARERRKRFASRDELGRLIPTKEFPITRALREQQPAEMLLELQPLDGSERRWIILKSNPVIDDQGNLRCVINRLRDVSEERRRAAEQRVSEARYRLLFESNPIPMWVFDLKTLRFLAVNDAAIHQYGWSREEFLSLTLLDIRPPSDRPAILQKLERISAEPDGLDVAGVWRHQRRDGTLLDVEVTTHAIAFDGHEARLSIAVNVTERIRHERRLQRLSALTADLAAALIPREVARVITQYAVSAGADVAAVAAYAAEDQMVTVLHRRGYPEHIPQQSGPFPISTMALLDHVIRTGQAVVAPRWDEFDQRFPELAASRHFAGDPGAGAGLILPLLVDDRPIGAIKMGFREPQVFPPTLLDELQTIAYLCAQALERAQLYEGEQYARAQAEIGERAARREADRVAIMAELSRTLAEAGLDVRSVLDAVARTTAEHTGDACAIVMLGDSDDEPAVEAIHHTDPTIQAALDRLIATGWREAIMAVAERSAATGEALLEPVLESGFGVEVAPAVGIEHGLAPAVYSLLTLPFRAHGQITGAMILLRLIPDHPYTEDHLTFFQELSDRAALALDNARLYQEAQVALRARDEFLSAAAHELRTPVTTVKGYAQMLLRSQVRAGLTSDRAAQFLQAIDESTDRLRVLTDDLLDVSRLRLGQMPLRPQPLNLVELAGQMIERYATQLDPRHTLTLINEMPVARVNVDPNRIEQVLSNLLENAVKYSPAGGEIVTTIMPDGDGVRLSVSDPGIGLPAEAVDSIFEPFNRAQNAIRDNVPGLGLGLYICHSIVARHGGHIRAESAGEGRGTTFHLWLPSNGLANPDDA